MRYKLVVYHLYQLLLADEKQIDLTRKPTNISSQNDIIEKRRCCKQVELIKCVHKDKVGPNTKLSLPNQIPIQPLAAFIPRKLVLLLRYRQSLLFDFEIVGR